MKNPGLIEYMTFCIRDCIDETCLEASVNEGSCNSGLLYDYTAREEVGTKGTYIITY